MADNNVINLLINVIQRGGGAINDYVKELGNADKAADRLKRRQDELNRSNKEFNDSLDDSNRRIAAHQGQIKRLDNDIARHNRTIDENTRLQRANFATDRDKQVALQRVEQAQLSLGRAERERANHLQSLSQEETNLQRIVSRNIVAYDNETTHIGRLGRITSNLRDHNSALGKSWGFLKHEMDDSGRSSRRLEQRLGRLGRTVLGLVIGSVIIFTQSFATALVGLAGSAVALAGSLVSAGTALGGVFLAAVAQAIPMVGILAETMHRMSLVQQAVNEYSLVQKQTSHQNTQQLGQEKDAADSVAKAQEGILDAQRNLTQARREARRELQDLILEEKQASLSARDAQSALKDALQSGDIGAVQNAQLGLQEARLRAGRAHQDVANARVGGPGSPQDRVIDATRQLTDANRALAASHRNAAQAAQDQTAAESYLGYFESLLSPAEQRLAKTIERLQNEEKRLFTPITDHIVNQFTFAINRIIALIENPAIFRGFDRLSTGIAGVLHRLTVDLTNRKSQAFFVDMLREGRKNLEPLERIAHNIWVLFRNIATAAAPVLHKMLKLIADETERWAKSSKDTKGMTRFFFEGLRQLRAWYGLLKATVRLILTLIGVSSDSAVKTIKDLTRNINEARESIERNPRGAKDFFAKSSESLAVMGRIIVAIGGAFLHVFNPKTLKGFEIIVTEVLVPALQNVTEILGQLSIWMGDALSHKWVARALEIAATFTIVKGSLNILMTLFLPFGTILKSIIIDLPIFIAGLFGIGPAAGSSAGGVAALDAALAPLGLTLGSLILIVVAVIAFVYLFRKEIVAAFKDSGISSAIGNFGKQFAELFSNINRLFGPNGKFSFIWKGVKFVVKQALTAAMIPLKVFLDTFSGFIDILNGIMEGDFSKVWDGVKKIITAPFKGALLLLKTMFFPFIEMGKLLAGALGGPFHALGKVFHGIGNIISDVFGTAKRIFQDSIDVVLTALNWVGNFINKLVPGSPFGHIETFAERRDRKEEAARQEAEFQRTLRERGLPPATTNIGQPSQDIVDARRKALDATKKQEDAQDKLNDKTRKGSAIANDFADKTGRAADNQKELQNRLQGASGKLDEQRGGIKKVIRGFNNYIQTLAGAGKNTTGLGKLISEVTNKILKRFGVKTYAFSIPGSGELINAAPFVGGGWQTGGFMGSPKQRGPDDRLIAVAGGEAVLTGHQQQPVNMALAFAKQAGMIPYGNLYDLFNKDNRPHATAPRFARGGMVDPAFDPGHELINSRIAAAVGPWLRRYHGDITAGYDPGGGHVSPGHNVTGTATDVIPGAGGGWNMLEKGLRVLVAAGFEVLYGSNGIGIPYPNHGRGNHAHIEWMGNGSQPNALNRLANMGYGAAGAELGNQIKRILIKGPASAIKDMLQGQADNLRKNANKKLAKLTAGATGAGYGDRVTGGDWERITHGVLGFNQLVRLAAAAGMPNPRLMAHIAQAESGGRVDVINSIGATGLWQIYNHPDLVRKYGKMTNAWHNAEAARDLLKTQGLQAWAASQSVWGKFAQRGGFIPRYQKGGVVSTKNRKELPNWLWGQMTAAATSGFLGLLGDSSIHNSLVSLPKDVKRTKKNGKEWEAWWNVLYSDSMGPHKFRAKAILRPKHIEFPADSWGGKPEWRPGYQKGGVVIPPDMLRTAKQRRRWLRHNYKNFAKIMEYNDEPHNMPSQYWAEVLRAYGRAYGDPNPQKYVDLHGYPLQDPDQWKPRWDGQKKIPIGGAPDPRRFAKGGFAGNLTSNAIRAQKVYESLWTLVRGFFNQTGSSPPVTWNDKAPRGAWAWVDPKVRNVHVTTEMTDALTKSYSGIVRIAKRKLLHEWAHVFQTPEVMNNKDPSIREWGASHFATALGNYLLRQKGKRTSTFNTDPWTAAGQFGFDSGGIIPGPVGQPTWIQAHAGETVLPTHKIKGFQTGGIANPQKTLEDSLKLLQLAPSQLRKISGKNFKKLIDALNELTREEGAIDDIAASIEAITTIMSTKLTLWALKIKNGIVTQVVSGVEKANRALQQLQEIGDSLGEEMIALDKTVAAVKKRIKKTKDKKKKRDLRTVLDGLQQKQADVEAAFAQNLQDTLDAQAEAWQAILDRFDQRLSDLDLMGQIIELQAKLSGVPDLAGMQANLQAKAGVLQEERAAIQAQYNQAIAVGNVELARELNTALLENQLALLQNTEAIQELNGTVGKEISFNSTAWTLFRRAVLNGMGGLLPNYQALIPSLQSGGRVISGGLVNLHAGEVVHDANAGPVEQHYHFTEPMEVADPTVIGAKIAWEWKKQKV